MQVDNYLNNPFLFHLYKVTELKGKKGFIQRPQSSTFTWALPGRRLRVASYWK
jgi:hypothetical protein